MIIIIILITLFMFIIWSMLKMASISDEKITKYKEKNKF